MNPGVEGLLPARLTVVQGPGVGREFPLERDITIGRSTVCDLVLEADAVSKTHARIRRNSVGFWIEDLRSLNGTFLDDQPVKKASLLEHGQKIRICEYVFLYELRDSDGSSVVLAAFDAAPSPGAELMEVRPEVKLRAVLEILGQLGVTLDSDLVLARTLQGLLRIFNQAGRGSIMLREDWDRGVKTPRAWRTRRGDPSEGAGPPHISRTVYDQVVGSRKALLSSDVRSDDRFITAESLAASNVRMVLCVPLLDHQQEPLGLVQLDSHVSRRDFNEEDLKVLMAVSRPVGLALDVARLHEQALHQAGIEQSVQDAREVQTAFLPRSRPEGPGFEFWDSYEPAEWIGGDYYGYVEPLDGESGSSPPAVVAALGDVAGKGMPAALLMAKLAAEVRLAVQAEGVQDPAAAVGRLNRLFYDELRPGTFITFVLLKLDPTRRILTLVTAGHPAPLLREVDGTVRDLGDAEAGPPLGVDRNHAYRAVEIDLSPGEAVVVFSDGITDATSEQGHGFGRAGLVDAIRLTATRSSLTAESIGQTILRSVREHERAGSPRDDRTLLVLNVPRPAAARPRP